MVQYFQWEIKPLRINCVLDATGPATNENGSPQAAVPVSREENAYFTPCISFWISGAIRNSSTPEPIRAQKPKV